jgi:hypothetical protein
MFKTIINYLFPTLNKTVKFDYNAIDRDGDGIVQEGTKFERKVVVKKAPVKKAAKKATVKKAAVKKTAKKAPVKKASVKKTAAKKK